MKSLLNAENEASFKTQIEKILTEKKSNLVISSELINKVFNAMDWLQMFSKEKIEISKNSSIIDEFCKVLQKKLVYGSKEFDMVCMHHEFITEDLKGNRVFLLIKGTNNLDDNYIWGSFWL